MDDVVLGTMGLQMSDGALDPRLRASREELCCIAPLLHVRERVVAEVGGDADVMRPVVIEGIVESRKVVEAAASGGRSPAVACVENK